MFKGNFFLWSSCEEILKFVQPFQMHLYTGLLTLPSCLLRNLVGTPVRTTALCPRLTVRCFCSETHLCDGNMCPVDNGQLKSQRVLSPVLLADSYFHVSNSLHFCVDVSNLPQQEEPGKLSLSEHLPRVFSLVAELRTCWHQAMLQFNVNLCVIVSQRPDVTKTIIVYDPLSLLPLACYVNGRFLGNTSKIVAFNWTTFRLAGPKYTHYNVRAVCLVSWSACLW